MKKIRWWIAVLLLCAIILMKQFGSEELINTIDRVVYGHEDIVWVRSATKSLLGHENEVIPVSTDSYMKVEKIESHDEGFIVTISEQILRAKEPGIILYTGNTPQSGGIMTVYYDYSEVFVTYGQLYKFSQLPYVTVKRNYPLAELRRNTFYIQIEKDGKRFNLEETKSWLEQ